MIRSAAFALIVMTQFASAETCSDFEQTVYELIYQAQDFQKTDAFREYGWSRNGPTQGWLDRWKEIRDMDNDLHLQFMQKYGYVPGELYSVADAYRTGSYDSFYADIEKLFTQGPLCD